MNKEDIRLFKLLKEAVYTGKKKFIFENEKETKSNRLPQGSQSADLAEMERVSPEVRKYLNSAPNSYKRKFELLVKCIQYINVFLKVSEKTGMPVRSSGFDPDKAAELRSDWKEYLDLFLDNPKSVDETKLEKFLDKCMGKAKQSYGSGDYKTTNLDLFISSLKRKYPDSTDPIDYTLDDIENMPVGEVKDFFDSLVGKNVRFEQTEEDREAFRLEDEKAALARAEEDRELKAKYGDDYETDAERLARIKKAQEDNAAKVQIQRDLDAIMASGKYEKETLSKVKLEKLQDARDSLSNKDITPEEFSRKVMDVLNPDLEAGKKINWKKLAEVLGFSGASGARQYIRSRLPKAFRYSISPKFKAEAYYEVFKKFMELYESEGIDPTSVDEKDPSYSGKDIDVFLVAQGISQQDFKDYFSTTDLTQTEAWKELEDVTDPEERMEIENELIELDHVMRTFITDNSHFRNFVTELLDLYYRKSVFTYAAHKIPEELVNYMSNIYPDFGKGYVPGGSRTYGTIQKDKGKDFIAPILNIVTGQAKQKEGDLAGISFAKGELNKDAFKDAVLKGAEKAKKADPKRTLGDAFHNFGDREAEALYKEFTTSTTPLGGLRARFLAPDSSEMSSPKKFDKQGNVVKEPTVGEFKAWFDSLKMSKLKPIFIKALQDANSDVPNFDYN